jgi:hypothetical protein
LGTLAHSELEQRLHPLGISLAQVELVDARAVATAQEEHGYQSLLSAA